MQNRLESTCTVLVNCMPPQKTNNNFSARSIEELKRSEATFRAMFETSAVGIGILGLDRKIIDANPAMCAMFGRTREQFIGLTPADATLPEDYPKSLEEFQELLDGKREYYWDERRYIHTNGDVFWAHVTMSVVRDDAGTPLYMVGMVIDIDDRKRAMLQMYESVERFRAIFDSSAIGIELLDLDGKILRANAAVCKMFGYSEEELQRLSDEKIVFPEDHMVGRELFSELVEGKRDSLEVEKRYVRKNGEVFWACLSLSPVRDAQGKIIYLVGMIDDIDEEKQVMANLQTSEARFRAMFENTSVGIALTSLDRQILQVNEAAARITGYSSEELLQINPIDLAIPEDRLVAKDTLQEMITGKREMMTVERRYQRKNGEIFWGRVTYNLVRSPDHQPQYLIGLIEDITDQKLAAEKLAAQKAEYLRTLERRVQERTHELSESNLRLVNEIEHRQIAEEALAAKAAEDAITSERTRLARELHDAVTQTLFSASLIAEVLPEIWEMDEAEARKSTEELRQLTRGALAEMRTLLLELRPAALTQARFPDLLKQLSEAVIGRARLPIRLDVIGDYEMPPEIKVAFYRIAQESLNNVVKYARATQVEIRLRLDCCDVFLEIKDNGIGFDPSAVKPTSLGMRIMHERADAIHAQLEISSSPGQGTTVSLDWNEDEVIPNSKITTRGET